MGKVHKVHIDADIYLFIFFNKFALKGKVIVYWDQLNEKKIMFYSRHNITKSTQRLYNTDQEVIS